MGQSELVNSWLRELGHKANIPDLKLNEDGSCVVQYKERLNVIILLLEQNPNVHFIAALMRPPKDRGEEFYKRLLSLNMMCLETHGATLALDERDDQVVLCYSHLVKDLDAEMFEEILGNFMETAEYVTDVISSNVPVTLSKSVNIVSSKKQDS